jgi:hypothetical protein
MGNITVTRSMKPASKDAYISKIEIVIPRDQFECGPGNVMANPQNRFSPIQQYTPFGKSYRD